MKESDLLNIGLTFTNCIVKATPKGLKVDPLSKPVNYSIRTQMIPYEFYLLPLNQLDIEVQKLNLPLMRILITDYGLDIQYLDNTGKDFKPEQEFYKNWNSKQWNVYWNQVLRSMQEYFYSDEVVN